MSKLCIIRCYALLLLPDYKPNFGAYWFGVLQTSLLNDYFIRMLYERDLVQGDPRDSNGAGFYVIFRRSCILYHIPRFLHSISLSPGVESSLFPKGAASYLMITFSSNALFLHITDNKISRKLSSELKVY